MKNRVDFQKVINSENLRRWGIEGIIERESTRDRLIGKNHPLTEEQRQNALRAYLSHVGINTDKELKKWMQSEFLDEAQLQCRSERFGVWLETCEKRFKNQMLSLFLKRKSQLDRVVYSLHWVDEEALAHELFIRLKERECSFEQLFCSLPDDRKEGLPSGKHGPTKLEMLPDALAQILRVSTPGQVWPPREAEGGWVILQLEELQPAIFDKRLKQQFALELGDRWLTEEMEAKPEKTVGSIGVTSVTGQKELKDAGNA